MSVAETDRGTLTDRRSLVRLWQMFQGYRVSQLVVVSAELGLADLLAEGPQTAAELARLANANHDALQRFLRAAAQVGLFEELPDGKFGLTALSQLLRTGVEGSLRSEARYYGHESCWNVWGQLRHSIQSGEPAFKKIYGCSPWEYRSAHPDVNELFNDAMTGHSVRNQKMVVEQVDFSDVARLIDVGGGHGELISQVLAKHPHTRGILLDQAHVVAKAPEILQRVGVIDRCEVVAGNYLEEIPSGATLCLLMEILNNWDDDRSLQILKNCRRALPDHGRIVLVENTIPTTNSAQQRLLDLHMMIIHGGRERTAAEFNALLDAAGFEPTRCVTPLGGVSVIEGRVRANRAR